ncbi:MAG: superoxide dismutase [Clostridia bacterium]|nr:superoxide dismutase [Clostridia bacterium]
MIKMIPLPYTLKALEPYYSKETLDLHYNILYKGYVEKTNNVLRKLEEARRANDYSNIKCLEKELAFQGSGAILHKLFFENMSPPNNQNSLQFKIMQKISEDFGSINNFKRQFSEAAAVVEASGWCILAWVPEFEQLVILQCEKHQDLTLWGCVPLLVFDMWEHSYYLQYQTRRPEYISAFWNIINWKEVNRRFLEICN